MASSKGFRRFNFKFKASASKQIAKLDGMALGVVGDF